MRYLIFALIGLAFACKSKKESSLTEKSSKDTITAKTVAVPNQTNDTIKYFTASFISIGSGIDRRIKTEYDNFFSKFQDENKTNLDRLIYKWGKEGELDYCFDLSPLNFELKTKFIKESSEILKKSERIHLKYNQECKSN